MTFYEQELRKLFADGTVIGSPKFTGRACLGTLGKDLRARVQFVTSGHADHYDVISVTVLNRTDGVVDKLRLRLKDILGVKQVPGNPNFRNGVAPHIWEDSGKVEWYAFRPSAADYSAMRQAVSEYLGVFRDRVTERRQDGPRLVYICAPLRGEVEKNIAFARDRAREVFVEGNVPICPHLMFPPIADPENPAQDHTPQIRITRSKTLKPRRCPCACWKPASRSTSTAPSGRRACGRRSTTPRGWGSLS